MAKLAFTKLGLKVNDEIKTVEFNGQIVEVKQYLPVNEKLELISKVLNNAADENNFANPVKIDIYTTIAIIEHYTNISFTEKQKENPTKLYDMFMSTDLYSLVVSTIPTEELGNLLIAITNSADAVYTYRNSVMGILENISTDYSNLNFDASAIQQKLADPENMELLRSVLSKLG